MSERLPYEEQLSTQLNDLPLPDVNLAWTDMKRRLEEEKDKPLIPWWRGCAGIALLGIVLLGLGWWIVRPEKWFSRKKEEISSNSTSAEVQPVQKDSLFINDTGNMSGIKLNVPKNDSPETIAQQPEKISSATKVPGKDEIKSNGKQQRSVNNQAEKDELAFKTKPGSKAKRSVKETPSVTSISGEGKNSKPEKDSALKPATFQANNDNPPKKIITTTKPDSSSIKPDDVTKNDSLPEKEKVKKAKTDSSKRRPLVFSAGIGLQQQLPVAGQKWSPYNALGRKALWEDYIPSVYFRMARPGKCFLQSEFRYGAPEFNKEILYDRRSLNDTGLNPAYTIKTSYTLRKTYYHQLPLAFNYFVAPNWSIGAGLQWNRFFAAVAEQEIIYHDNLFPRDSLLSKNIIQVKGDTATEFKKSFFQTLFETQLQLKRFSFGARYTRGLQPFITYTLPGGTEQKQKNQSVQLFIRYELWRSKNRK